MFKKPLNLGTTNKVSKADKKKVLRHFQDKYALSPEDGELILPLKEDVDAVKVASPSRAVVYVVAGVPMLVDSSGKGDYFPTVFALWKLPELLPHVYVKQPEVSHFVVKGADLMLPGVDIPSLGAFQEGGIVAICSPGNPAPVGVGVAAMSSADAAERSQGSQGRGRLVELLQHYGDFLWGEMGQSAVPNPGFQPGVVLALDAGTTSSSGSEGPPANNGAGVPASTGTEVSPVLVGTELSHVEAAEVAVGQLQLADDSALPAESTGGMSGATPVAAAPEDMDALLEACLLQALHNDVKDKELPLNSNGLWKMMVAGRPSGTTLDVKKSKHKKLSKLLQVHHKAGLITAKEDRHSGDSIITSINRKHKLYLAFEPYEFSPSTPSPSHASSASSAPPSSTPTAAHPSGPPSTSAASAASSHSQVTVRDVFKPCKEMKPILEALGARPDAFYPADELYDLALAYIKHAQLGGGGGGPPEGGEAVVLDAHLCDALYKGVVNVKKGELYPTTVARGTLREAWLGRCQQQFLITRGDKQVVRKGQPMVHVSVQKRQGAKKVTVVEGLESFLLDPAETAAECRQLFASSATVNELPGKHNPGCEVVVQGAVAEKLAAHLAAAHGVPKACLKVKS